MLHRVNTGAMFGVSAQGAYHNTRDAVAAGAGINTIRGLHGVTGHAFAGKNGALPESEPEPAAILDFSVEGRDLALRTLYLRKYDPETSLFKFDDAFLSEEARAQRKADSAKLLGADIRIHSVSPEGTLDRLVQDVVNTKMDPITADSFTAELSRLIRGTWGENGNLSGTVEERAANREKGLKLAEYIAETYIDEPEERENFLDGVKRFYDNAVLREKGYLVTEGPNGVTISKPGEPVPGASDTNIFIEAYKVACESLSETEFADDEARFAAVKKVAITILLRNPKYESIAKQYAAGEISIEKAEWAILDKNMEPIRRALKEAGEKSLEAYRKVMAEKRMEALAAKLKEMEQPVDRSQKRKSYAAAAMEAFAASFKQPVNRHLKSEPDVATDKKPVFSEPSNAFAANEKEVDDAIARVKNSLDMNAVNADVQRTIKEITSTFVSYADYSESLREFYQAHKRIDLT